MLAARWELGLPAVHKDAVGVAERVTNMVFVHTSISMYVCMYVYVQELDI